MGLRFFKNKFILKKPTIRKAIFQRNRYKSDKQFPPNYIVLGGIIFNEIN